MIKDIVQFFDGVRREFSKVIWPGRDELIGATIVVLVIVTLFSIYLGALDKGFGYLAAKLFTFK